MSTLKVNTIQEADGSAFPFIGMQDSWIITGNADVNGGATLTSNWARHTASNSLCGNIGSAMSESSGIFTFPSTGIYFVTSQMMGYCNGGRTYVGMIHNVSNDSGSSYNEASKSYGNGYQNTSYVNAIAIGVYSVANASTFRIKFNYNVSDTISIKGSSISKETGVTFTKLGDI